MKKKHDCANTVLKTNGLYCCCTTLELFSCLPPLFCCLPLWKTVSEATCKKATKFNKI